MRLIQYRLYSRFQRQKQVAELLGLDPSNLSKILTGVTRPSAYLFMQLLEFADMVIIRKEDR